jgi:hypothetical protein
MNDSKLDLTETVGIIADLSAPAISITAVSEEVVVHQESEPVVEEQVVEEQVVEEQVVDAPTEENTEG